MTNADVIRGMTDEQLAYFLAGWEDSDIDYSCTFCDLCQEHARETGESGNELHLDCDGCRLWWLKQDAETAYNGLKYPHGINSGYTDIPSLYASGWDKKEGKK